MDFDFGRSSTKCFCSRSAREARRVLSRAVMIAEIKSYQEGVSLADGGGAREEQKITTGSTGGVLSDFPCELCVPCGWEFLQYVAGQILIFHDLAQHLLHVGCVYHELLAFLLGRLEADFV